MADARARLLRFRRTSVESEVKQEWRERIAQQRPGGGDYVEVTTARTTQRAAGELRGSVVVEATANAEGKGFVGHARVRCPERTLRPHLRLQTLEADQAAGAQRFLDLAIEYGADEPGLAEQTLRIGWSRTGDARVAFALAQAMARGRRDGEALHFAAEALRQAAGDERLRERIESLVREVKARVPTVAELARELVEAARRRGTPRDAAPTLTRAKPGRVLLGWSVPLEDGERIVKTWIDDDLTLHWRTLDEKGQLEDMTDTSWEFAWPPASAGASGATCVFWRMPATAKVWEELPRIENKAWPRAAPASEAERLRIASALRGLVEQATAVAVLELPVR
ncbi:MAG: hypothetical protein R3F56_08255 [Planctomycetota bacterium]